MDSHHVERITKNIISFDNQNHAAWNYNTKFTDRISDLPLYFLEFNHRFRNPEIQSVTITHYVPYRSELIAISNIINSIGKNLTVCDIGCGNGFLGSLLAREGVNVFGIDNRSYRQPQIANFYDEECYSITEDPLSSSNIKFDVAFCSWMTPSVNITPQILLKKPLLIIHALSPDKQPDGSPTTGNEEAYICPKNYKPLMAWLSFTPADYFSPLREISQLNLSSTTVKNKMILIHVHNDVNNVKTFSPRDYSELYDWDIDRYYINKLRNERNLQASVLKLLEPNKALVSNASQR